MWKPLGQVPAHRGHIILVFTTELRVLKAFHGWKILTEELRGL